MADPNKPKQTGQSNVEVLVDMGTLKAVNPDVADQLGDVASASAIGDLERAQAALQRHGESSPNIDAALTLLRNMSGATATQDTVALAKMAVGNANSEKEKGLAFDNADAQRDINTAVGLTVLAAAPAALAAEEAPAKGENRAGLLSSLIAMAKDVTGPLPDKSAVLASGKLLIEKLADSKTVKANQGDFDVSPTELSYMVPLTSPGRGPAQEKNFNITA